MLIKWKSMKNTNVQKKQISLYWLLVFIIVYKHQPQCLYVAFGLYFIIYQKAVSIMEINYCSSMQYTSNPFLFNWCDKRFNTCYTTNCVWHNNINNQWRKFTYLNMYNICSNWLLLDYIRVEVKYIWCLFQQYNHQ